VLVTKPISRAKMPSKNRDSRCKARAKNGKPCRAAATAGGLCFFHANPNKASELGRIGGKNKRSIETQSVDPLPKLDKASAIQEAVDRLFADVYAGKLQPKIATGLASLLSLQLRAIETTNLERRIDKMERLLGKAEKALPGPTQPPSPLSQEPRAAGDSGTNALARKPQASEDYLRPDDPSSRWLDS
jgi:hypothetical protein